MKNKDLVVEITQEQRDAQLASGLSEDEIVPPGKHTFRRGGFKERFPKYDPKTSKARINIYIDLDVLDHFRSRADKPNAAPYQTQINAELRKIMERDLVKDKETIDATVKELLKNDKFIAAISEKLNELRPA